MPNLTIKLTTCTLAVLALLSSVASPAQDQRWFRVELLVFANESKAQPNGAALPEQWDATPTLAYPVASRFLVDPAQVVGNKAEFGGESVLDDYGRQIITILTESPPGDGAASGQEAPVPAQGSAQTAAVAPGPAPAPLTPVYSGSAPTAEQPMAEQPMAAQSALPRPFVVLPRGYQEFSGKAALMQRGGRYSVLFHETWVQPVAAEASSLPIVLDHSGDSQQWPRLQGTIKLSLSRYLQLETNLWLNTAGEYLPGTWRMPAPPFGPPSLVIEEEQIVDVAAALADMPATTAPVDDTAAVVVQTDAAGNMIVDEAAAGPDGGLPAAASPLEAEVVEAIAPVYPYRHAVLLQQTRRMRSSEVHYIDHPMLGLIIKFTPVTAEQLTAIAAEEASLLDEAQEQ
jgi:hypothetical protein